MATNLARASGKTIHPRVAAIKEVAKSAARVAVVNCYTPGSQRPSYLCAAINAVMDATFDGIQADEEVPGPSGAAPDTPEAR